MAPISAYPHFRSSSDEKEAGVHYVLVTVKIFHMGDSKNTNGNKENNVTDPPSY
jgi:hypothetical protein